MDSTHDKPSAREIIDPSTLEAIGQFRRTHALRGELNAELYDDLSAEQLRELIFVIVNIDGIPTPFRIESIRPKGAVTILVKLAGIDSADSASVFVNQTIYADTQRLETCRPTDEEDMEEEGVYAADLTGYRAEDMQGSELGVIERVDLSTANPLLELLTETGQTILIPVNGPFISHIDPEARIVAISAPDALLGLNIKKL